MCCSDNGDGDGVEDVDYYLILYMEKLGYTEVSN